MKRKLTVLFFALCCIFVSKGAFAAEGWVRVGMNYAGSAAKSADFKSDYGLKFFNAVTGDLLYTSSAGEIVGVGISESGFSAEGKFSAPIDKLSVQSVNKTPITYSSEAYRGYFLLERSGATATVINLLPMNQYLYSVLGKEMSAYFPAEALKAQAICAKNFVLGEKDRHSKYGFDVCATTHCQVYGGIKSEDDRITAAVDAVEGIAAYYGGEIVPLYFFATDAGMTENAENVWGMDIPYLKAVLDPYEPADKAAKYTWTSTLTAAEIEERLSQKGINIGALTGISIDEASPSGRVIRLTFIGAEGSKTVSRESCRTTIGTDKLYSQNFTVTVSEDGVYTFEGKGYGHGVGMSQWGAYGMALAGFSYEDILTHYFTGIELKAID